MKENARAEVRNEVADQMAAEFDQEMAKARDLHKTELDELKR